jgi:hypothetical protein
MQTLITDQPNELWTTLIINGKRKVRTIWTQDTYLEREISDMKVHHNFDTDFILYCHLYKINEN